jgi:hypothetical protein
MASPTVTSKDIVLDALGKLGVLESGQSPEPEDFDKVNVRLAAIFRKLRALELVYIGDPENIPGEWQDDLGAIVAGMVATDFGSTPDDYVKLVNAGLGGAANVPVGAGTAAMSLKIMTRGRPTGETLQSYYF